MFRTDPVETIPTMKRLQTSFIALARIPLMIAGLVPVVAIAQVAPVEVAVVERSDIVETLSLTGSLSSPNSARLSPDVEGRLVSLKVDAGQRVNAGDILFKLDDELARLELAQAIAAEHEAKADLADTRRRVTEVAELVAEGSFPESEARSLTALVERNQAILERRRAERAYAAARLEHHSLKAPFSGVVAERNADLGERVDTDSNVLLLVATDRLQLDLRIPQKYFQRIRPGTPVTMRLDALPEQTLTASVAQIVPVSDPDARTFRARAEVDNAAGQLTPGMSVRAVVRIGTNRKAEVVPRDALIRYPDGRTIVWVVEVDGDSYVVKERRVKTGLSFDDKLEIIEGLVEGERVVIRGNEALQQDQQVRVSG
jgi:RND family efflux transporter MFP subunit